MLRLSAMFCLVSTLVCLAGCRICSTPYDCRVPANIDRYDDYRGFDPMYRGGSVFSCEEGYMSCQPVVRDAYFPGCTGEFFSNAGNYGFTSPVTVKRRDFDGYGTPTRRRPWEGSVVIPQDEPGGESNYMPRWQDDNVPSVEELLRQQRTTGPGVMQTVPPTRPRVPTFESSPGESIPFSPSDEIPFTPSDVIIPQDDPFPVPADVDLAIPITLEELRRLDPSVRDFEIISIEDAGVEPLVR